MLTEHGVNCVIEREETYTNDLGETLRRWNRVTDYIRCWKQPITAEIRQIYLANKISVNSTIYFSGVVEILEGDRILINENYCVVYGVRNMAGLDRLMAVDVREQL